MENTQNPTESPPVTPDFEKNVGLTQAQEYYITFVAANGLSVTEDGVFKKITATEFARSIDVHRDTLYDWQKRIPNFWQLVDKRAREIFNQNRKFIMLNGLFLRAAKGDTKQFEILMSHYSDYTPPTQKHEVRVNGLADLAKLARSKNERVTVDESSTTTD